MQVLYIDETLLVVNKPAGIPVLPDGWQPDAPYLVRLLEQEYGRVFVVHRLDKVTSGAIVFALNPEAHRALDIQFHNHRVEKLYHAIATGIPRWREHTARHPLRLNVGHKHRTVVDPGRGKPCETSFTVLKTFQTAVLLAAMPRTGRTHQVRAHAAALGHPLLSDLLYGASPSDLIARPALHATSLTFMHPTEERNMTFEAPYPQDFISALSLLDGLPGS